VLYVVAVLFIVGAWAWGCRESDRPAIVATACVCAIALVPALIWAVTSDNQLADGSAYALTVMVCGSCAMLLHDRSDPDDGGEERGGDHPTPPSGDDPSPFPVDWDDFERRYWEEVARRGRPKVPA
jgi:hypothetical protein